MTINEKIFSLIEQKQLKQADLAKKLNVRTSVIASWKTRGSNPPIEYAAQICEFLNITIYELLDIEPNCEIERLYKKCSPKDKATIDLILSEYKEQEQKSFTTKIG